MPNLGVCTSLMMETIFLSNYITKGAMNIKFLTHAIHIFIEMQTNHF